MDETGIEEIARQLCELFEQQMKAISGRGFLDLAAEELAAYQQRGERIGALRAELARFVHRA
jgi:hypothetical protein